MKIKIVYKLAETEVIQNKHERVHSLIEKNAVKR